MRDKPSLFLQWINEDRYMLVNSIPKRKYVVDLFDELDYFQIVSFIYGDWVEDGMTAYEVISHGLLAPSTYFRPKGEICVLYDG